jgi:hypothetical protein
MFVQLTTGMSASLLVAARWSKSSLSNPDGSCVELAALDGAVAVRDSRDPHGPALICSPAAFRRFLLGVKEGEFNEAHAH